MNVQGPLSSRDSVYQATWPILVIRTVLDDLTRLYCFTYLSNRNASQDRLINSMFREFKLASGKLGANLLNEAHCRKSPLA
jgi:hypothetical protein